MNPASAQVILALGGNLGDRPAILHQALSLIRKLPETELLAISDTYETTAVSPISQPDYLNLCLAIRTQMSPQKLLAECLSIESNLGRIRSERNGPRTCDIDLLFFGKLSLKESTLTLPHPRWTSRGFVVFPLRNLLQREPLANCPEWDWLRTEVSQLSLSTDGLRLWTGPTPWMTQKI